MNNSLALRKKLIEIVAMRLDRIDQRLEGTWPPNTDMDRWKWRYIGQNVPPPYVEINHFRAEVDYFVHDLLAAIDSAAAEEIKRVPI